VYEMGRACNTHGRKEQYIRDFVGKARGNQYEDVYIKMYLREIIVNDMEWIHLA
jgi:hypothetical protein